MYTEEDKIKIAELLRDCRQLMNPVKLKRIPGNYAQLKEAALLEELSREVQKLTALFSPDATSEALLKQAFLKLCAEREKQNQGTCMSYTALPEGICNGLYLEIATVLFKPRHFGELVTILLPGMKASLTAELVFSQTYSSSAASLKAEENLDVALREEPFAAYANYPAQRSMLTQVVTGDNVVFNLESISNLPLRLREQFHRLIVEYPALKNQIYKHNDDLQQLLFDLELINKHGATPDEMLLHLSNELLRAGTRFTGNVIAASSVTGSCSQFRHYLDQLPSGLEEKLAAMHSTDGTDSLAKVLEHLAGANCVENAAERIIKIRENPANKELLMSHPGNTKEQEYRIQQKYKKAIEVTGFESTNKLPEKLKQGLIRNIRIQSAHDYIDLILNLPPEEYLTFLTHASITCTPPLPEQLASGINMLNTAQATAFFAALFAQKDKFGGSKTIALLAVRCNQITAKVLQAIPEKELHSLITTVGRFEASLLVLAAQNSNPEIWKSLWDQLSTGDRLELVNKADGFRFGLLYQAAGNSNPEILRAMLEFLPGQERLTSLKNKDTGKESPLDVAIKNSNPAILQTIRQSLSTEDYQKAIIDEDLSLLAKVIDSNNTENLLSLIAYLKQHDLMRILRNKSKQNINILHRAARCVNPEIARILLAALTELEIRTLLSEHDINSCTPLDRAAVINLDIYIIMMNLLTDNERLAVLRNGWSIDRLARTTPEKWNRIWSLFKDKNKFASLFLGNGEGLCFLHVASGNCAAIWHDLWGALTSNQRAAFVKRKIKDKSLLQYLAAEGHFEAWSDVWEFHSENERLAIIGEKSEKGETILHYAAENFNPEVTRAILQFLCANNLLTALNITASDGTTPLYAAILYKNTSFLVALMELIPAKDRLTALKHKSGDVDSLLHLAAKKGDCWRVFWQLLPADDRSGALKEKNKLGETPLDMAMRVNSKVISIMLSPLSQQERMLILSEKDLRNDTPIYRALECTGEVWSSIWNYMPEQLRLSEIREKKHGSTLLHIAAAKNKPALVAAILRLLPAQGRLAALTGINADGNTPLHIAARWHDNEMLSSMLEYMPQPDYLSAFMIKNKDGDSVLHVARTSGENFYTILQALPEGDRLTALEVKNNLGLNPLNAAINSGNENILIKIPELLPLNEILILLKAKDNNGSNPLHWAGSYPVIIMRILNMLPEGERLLILNERSEAGDTPLHLMAKGSGRINFWSDLWKLFSDKNKFAALFAEQKNNLDVCPLHWAASQRGNTAMWDCVWGTLNANQKTVFALSKIKEGTRLLHIAAQAGCLKIWRQVWAFYSEQERLTAVTERSVTGLNLLHWATENIDVEVSRDIVEFLSKHKLSSMLTEKSNDGNTPFHSAIINNNSLVLSVLLESIPSRERLTILKQQNGSGKAPLHLAAESGSSDFRDVIWWLLPVRDRLSSLTIESRARERKVKFSFFQLPSKPAVVTDAPHAKM